MKRISPKNLHLVSKIVLISVICLISCLLFTVIYPKVAIGKYHMQEHHDPEDSATQRKIAQLLKNANTAYKMSIPLLASSLLGEEKIYRIALERIKTALDDSKDDADVKAWLYGRVLLSAKSMKDNPAIQAAKQDIESHLSDKGRVGAYNTWAMGYLAALDKETFNHYKDRLLALCEELTAKYANTRSHNDLSDAIWGWVMALQASALAGEQDIFNKIIEKIIQITGAKTLADALATGLHSAKTSSDYPAWALAIATFSAAKLNDSNYPQLENATAKSIKSAEQDEQPGDALLGELTLSLAKNCELQSQATNVTTSLRMN
jgi:hypothetical protein